MTLLRRCCWASGDWRARISTMPPHLPSAQEGRAARMVPRLLLGPKTGPTLTRWATSAGLDHRGRRKPRTQLRQLLHCDPYGIFLSGGRDIRRVPAKAPHAVRPGLRG